MDARLPNFEKKFPVQRIVDPKDGDPIDNGNSFINTKKTFADESFELHEQRLKEIQQREITKDEKDIEIINLVNQKTNELLKKYNLNARDISIEQIHLLSEKDYNQLLAQNTDSAEYSWYDQLVFVKKNNSDLIFAMRLFHELIHFKSYQAIQITNQKTIELYRLGLIANSHNRKDRYFQNMNEAITEKLSKQFYGNELKLTSLFQAEIEDAERLREYSLTTAKNLAETENAIDIFQADFNQRTFECFGYPEQRRALDELIGKLFNKNREKFKNKKQVFDMFVKAMLSGDLLELGKLIDRTFGQGTFRKIGELDAEPEKLKEFINTL